MEEDFQVHYRLSIRTMRWLKRQPKWDLLLSTACSTTLRDQSYSIAWHLSRLDLANWIRDCKVEAKIHEGIALHKRQLQDPKNRYLDTEWRKLSNYLRKVCSWWEFDVCGEVVRTSSNFGVDLAVAYVAYKIVRTNDTYVIRKRRVQL